MTVNYFQQANKFFREGKLDNAINAYRKYIAVNPNFFHAYQNLGDALIKVQRFDEAVEAFRKAVDLNSQAVWSFFKLGELLYKKEDFEAAVFFLRRAVELKSDVAEFNLGIGKALAKLDSQNNESEFFLRRAKNLNPLLVEFLFAESFLQSEVEDTFIDNNQLFNLIPGISNEFHNKIPTINFQEMKEEFTPYNHANPVDSVIKMIAHYLPQFHPFPENDEWWGKGFTEWTNVGKAKPCYRGHNQPHCPIHFGYYDLRVPTILEEQVNLATEYGIYGFNFYFYWFAGKILMEMPLKSFTENKKIDLKFCLTWANENWTRRWDGQENDILIAQEHSDDDSLKFIKHLIEYFKDNRYIKIDGKPLLIIYRTRIIPNIKEIANLWRQEVKSHGFPGLYLVSAQTFGISDPREFSFDAAIEFPPHTVSSPEINNLLPDLIHEFSGRIYSYDEVVNNEVRKTIPTNYKIFRSTMLSWDNTARKGKSAHIFHGFTLTRYMQWLRSLCFSTMNNKNLSSEENFVFINAWNEWAEGTHLEPDNLYGYGYLEATRRIVNEFDTLIIRKLSNQKLQKNNNYALVIHLHYSDLWEEIREILKKLEGFDIYVTTTSSALANKIKYDVSSAFVIFVENRGRDILPFIEVLRLIHSFDYKVCCKIHSKKSLYRTDGDKIRDELFSSLLPTEKSILSNICSAFDKNDRLGLVVPKKYLISHGPQNMLYNNNNIENLCKKMDIKFNPSFFPAGSMFWFRPRALSRLLLLSSSDFEVESGLCDGTTAHAVERLFCTVSYYIGYNTDVI